MKIGNLLALPLALIADAVTFGGAGVTNDIMRDEQGNGEIEAVKDLAQAIIALQNKR